MPVLDVLDRHVRVGRVLGHAHPALVHLAPGRGMRRRVAPVVPGARGHQAPVADALRGVVGVVEVGPPEDQVPQLVGADADPRVLRDREVGEEACAVRRELGGEHPLVRPDVAVVAGDLCAATRVDHDERVDEAIGVVVVEREVHVRVGGHGGITRHGAGVRLLVSHARLAVGVRRQGRREPVGPDDLALEIDQSVRDPRRSSRGRCRSASRPRRRRAARSGARLPGSPDRRSRPAPPRCAPPLAGARARPPRGAPRREACRAGSACRG